MPAAASNLLPLKPVDLEILLALADGDRHGYGLVQAVEQHTDGLVVLDPGNLYRVIKRLLDAGLVTEAGRNVSNEAGGKRRKYYAITALGERVLVAELERLRRLVTSTATRAVARRLTP